MASKLSLHQSQFLKGARQFELHENGQLHVHTKDYTGERAYVVELHNLLPKTLSAKSTALFTWIAGYIVAAVALFFVLAIIIGCFRQPIAETLHVFTSFGVFALFIGAIAYTILRRALRNSFDVTIFYFRQGGQAFSILNNRPNPSTARSFIQQLIPEIERATPIEIKGDGLADQLARLDELRTRGILSDEEFAAAKQRLLKMGAEEKRIGFQ